jgi:hypothetical protein
MNRHLLVERAVLIGLVLVLTPLNGAIAECYDRNGNAKQQRFVLNGGLAFDTKTGLTWKRCSLGTTYDGRRGCTGDKMFVNLDTAMRLANETGDGSRVPSGPELESIIDPSCGTPVVDKSVFPDINPDDEGAAEYWTTNAVGMESLFYYFDFMTGQADGHTRGYELAVRLVKQPQ